MIIYSTMKVQNNVSEFFFFCGLQTKSKVDIRSNQIRERKNRRRPRLDWRERIQRPKANRRESLIGLFTKSKKLWNQPKQTTKHNIPAVGWNSDEGLTWKVKTQRDGDWPSWIELRERRPPPSNDNWQWSGRSGERLTLVVVHERSLQRSSLGPA